MNLDWQLGNAKKKERIRSSFSNDLLNKHQVVQITVSTSNLALFPATDVKAHPSSKFYLKRGRLIICGYETMIPLHKWLKLIEFIYYMIGVVLYINIRKRIIESTNYVKEITPSLESETWLIVQGKEGGAAKSDCGIKRDIITEA